MCQTYIHEYFSQYYNRYIGDHFVISAILVDLDSEKNVQKCTF